MTATAFGKMEMNVCRVCYLSKGSFEGKFISFHDAYKNMLMRRTFIKCENLTRLTPWRDIDDNIQKESAKGGKTRTVFVAAAAAAAAVVVVVVVVLEILTWPFTTKISRGQKTKVVALRW
jgi:hypothetical protein